jgi:hypothetical protein
VRVAVEGEEVVLDPVLEEPKAQIPYAVVEYLEDQDLCLSKECSRVEKVTWCGSTALWLKPCLTIGPKWLAY